MLLSDLIEMASDEAEDYGVFRIVISATSDDLHYKTTDKVQALFNVDEGTLTLEEIE